MPCSLTDDNVYFRDNLFLYAVNLDIVYACKRSAVTVSQSGSLNYTVRLESPSSPNSDISICIGEGRVILSYPILFHSIQFYAEQAGDFQVNASDNGWITENTYAAKVLAWGWIGLFA